MRALIIGESEKAAIAELKARAAEPEHIVDAERAVAKGRAAAFGNRDFTISIPMGYAVTYTHERQPAGLCQHLSVSVDAKGKAPRPAAVDMILGAFGMRPFRQSLMVWTEEFAEDSIAINVLQMIESPAQ